MKKEKFFIVNCILLFSLVLLEKDEILIPIHSAYYDDNGNIINSN